MWRALPALRDAQVWSLDALLDEGGVASVSRSEPTVPNGPGSLPALRGRSLASRSLQPNVSSCPGTRINRCWLVVTMLVVQPTEWTSLEGRSGREFHRLAYRRWIFLGYRMVTVLSLRRAATVDESAHAGIRFRPKRRPRRCARQPRREARDPRPIRPSRPERNPRCSGSAPSLPA